MEAELTALDTATVEAEWLRELLMDLPVVEKPIPACNSHTFGTVKCEPNFHFSVHACIIASLV